MKINVVAVMMAVISQLYLIHLPEASGVEKVRVFLVQNKIVPSYGTGGGTYGPYFEQEMKRIMEVAGNYFISSGEGHNLLVFPEYVTLVRALARLSYSQVGNYRYLEDAVTASIVEELSSAWQDRRDLCAMAKYMTGSLSYFSYLAKRWKVYILAGSVVEGFAYNMTYDADPPNPNQDAGWIGNRRGVNYFNGARMFGPDGNIMGTFYKKVLTVEEKLLVGVLPFPMSPPKRTNLPEGKAFADYEEKAVATPFGKVGALICKDAFDQNLARTMDEKGGRLLVQPSWLSHAWGDYVEHKASVQDKINPNKWWPPYLAWDAPVTAQVWQPEEWLSSTLGTIQANFPSIKFNLCAMSTGNLYEMASDGQSSVTGKSATIPSSAYVGLSPADLQAKGMTGVFHALAPWVSTATDRDVIVAEAKKRLPGGAKENQYQAGILSVTILPDDRCQDARFIPL